MTLSIGSRLLAALLLALLPVSALAWSEQGHMATGAIAHDRLMTLDPNARVAVVAIMASHPDAKRFERNLAGLTGVERERALFMWMARWPDDIREGPWDRPKAHYFATVAGGWTWLDGYRVGDAESAFVANMAILRNRAALPADRAVALCWLFHIAGDMQQPLHAGLRVDWTFLKSDRLGTTAWVRSRPGGEPLELHQLWDRALDRLPADAPGALLIAQEVSRVPLTPAQTAVDPNAATTFARWFGESFALAKRRGYTADGMAATPAPADAPVMSAPYLKRMRALAVVRVAQGGERLAALLAQAL